MIRSDLTSGLTLWMQVGRGGFVVQDRNILKHVKERFNKPQAGQ